MVMLLTAEGFNMPLVMLFAGYDPGLFSLTSRGFALYAAAFLMMGGVISGVPLFLPH